MLRLILKKIPYELYKGGKPNIAHLHTFGYKCYVLNNEKDNLAKFDAKVGDGLFLVSGYSLSNKAFRIYR